MFFGWVFLLARGAFASRTDRCADCEETFSYKSVGSWIALAFLLFVAFCVTVYWISERPE